MNQREEIRKPPPDFVGGKPRLDCREEVAVVADEQMVDRGTLDCHDSREIWRRSKDFQVAADARQSPWKRGKVEETRGQKNLGGGAGCVRFRSGVETRVRKRARDGGYL